MVKGERRWATASAPSFRNNARVKEMEYVSARKEREREQRIPPPGCLVPEQEGERIFSWCCRTAEQKREREMRMHVGILKHRSGIEKMLERHCCLVVGTRGNKKCKNKKIYILSIRFRLWKVVLHFLALTQKNAERKILCISTVSCVSGNALTSPCNLICSWNWKCFKRVSEEIFARKLSAKTWICELRISVPLLKLQVL